VRSEELGPELAGIISRMQHRILVDPRYAQVLGRDEPSVSRDFILSGIEDAIAGLIMLHIQVRRDFR
jgi:hypothetical protein